MVSRTLQEMYSEWDLIKSNYKRYRFPLNFQDFDQSGEKCFRSQEQVLWQILETFVHFSKFKDSFSKRSLDWYPYGGMSLKIYSEKLENSINFGIYEGCIFLETEIIHPSYLYKMTDEFWIRLMQLPNYGQFEFVPHGTSPNDKESRLKLEKLSSNKSQFFNIIANYIFGGADECKLDFGMLVVKWPIDTSWDNLLNSGCEVFKILYKTNYDLYRHVYQLAHGRSKAKKA